MKVIKIISGNTFSITADNTDITADDTGIRADATVNDLPANTYMICITPRQNVNNVKLILTNEMDKSKINQTLVVDNIDGKMYITFTVENIKDGTTFRAVVNTVDDELLWRGKVYATSQTNIQDFKMNVPNSNNKIIM